MSTLERFVYRIFDVDGRLIYVGSSRDVPARLTQHRATKWWSEQIATVKAVGYRSATVARDAERAAILTEHPRWNSQGRWASREQWTDQQWWDYITTLERTGAATAKTRAHIEHVHRLNIARVAVGEHTAARAAA